MHGRRREGPRHGAPRRAAKLLARWAAAQSWAPWKSAKPWARWARGQVAGRLREAEGVARSALALVVAARGEAVVRRAEKGIHGAPSLSAASVLQPAGGPEPYSSADDALQHHLASANAELLLWACAH